MRAQRRRCRVMGEKQRFVSRRITGKFQSLQLQAVTGALTQLASACHGACMNSPPKQTTLNRDTYRRGVSELVRQDAALAAVVSKWGRPPFWTHAPGFPGLVMAILAQQVSLESARAAFDKLKEAIDSVDPQAFLSLEDETLRAIGFSRQKASYARGLARGIMTGEVDLAALESAGNDDARKRLMQWRGVGAWTAEAYLLFSLRRADAWPSGDLALAKAIAELNGSAARPGREQVDRFADRWRPWRAVAARILWHHYLCERGRDVWA